MGTNFYLAIRGKKTRHLGKRSAAGFYCWDCGVTLCMDGNKAIHLSGSRWHDVCPKCGKSKTDEGMFGGAGGRELGFNKSKPKKKTGVASCSSFGWAVKPEEVDAELDRLDGRKKVIKDEYGRRFTKGEFKRMLSECPIQYRDMIGTWFR